ncbi:Crp/Fnr family transcriptional regulator [Crocosphaera sp. XPORK-15E]|uniref:Crp/Fnr family transcriptional regulator n=1 Tax=Crocosphaera sp. XPORK-15E TaxID=3110247 RepID=UPI002B219ACC|nr:Crp/Fnr family transcriptional regulator [Crocosphaera sp. XPORK-15E]MEA5533918.1 Crp/Fnr family transcriptional regulator [Crocosphaera sp. XPORK-15E]
MLLAYNPTQPLSPHEVTEGGRLHFYDRGENIPLVSDGIWQVYRGITQLSQLSPHGEEILLGWAQPSTLFGLWLTQMESYQAKALSDVYLKWYPVDEIQNSSQLSQMALTQLVRRMRQTEALLAIAGLKRVEDRLQQLLYLLKQELGEPVKEGTRLGVRLTHQNLASAIGTTRVTVTRLLGDFQRQGWLSFDGDRHIIIAEPFLNSNFKPNMGDY